MMTWGAMQAPICRFVTLTLVPVSWQHAREQIKDFIRRLRKSYQTEMAWAIEPNPRGTGHHLHAIQWGEYTPQERLEELWGGRRVWIEKMKRDGAGYMTKAAIVAGYSTKNATQVLDLNGGRAVHMTRGYLHGLTSRQVRKELRTDKKWYLVPATIEEIRASLAITAQVQTVDDT